MTQFEEILKILTQNHVEFILIGGLAAVVHGFSGATADLDVVYSRAPGNVKKIIKALSPHHVRLRALDENLPFFFDEKTFENCHNFTLTTDLGDLDLLFEIPGFQDFTDILSHSERIEVFNMECRVLSLEGLIHNKKACARPKDLLQLQELEAIKRIKDEGNK